MRALQRSIAKIGFKAGVAIRRTFTRNVNLDKRTSLALRHVHWKMSAWLRVLFIDETNFAVKPINNNSKVWRKEVERLNTQCMLPTYKSGYEMMKCWGGFSLRGRTPLLRI